MSGWQDIASAPRDGTWIRIRADDERCAVGRWRPQFYRGTGITYDWEVIDVLHRVESNHWADGYAVEWMPLPEAPDTHPTRLGV